MLCAFSTGIPSPPSRRCAAFRGWFTHRRSLHFRPSFLPGGAFSEATCLTGGRPQTVPRRDPSCESLMEGKPRYLVRSLHANAKYSVNRPFTLPPGGTVFHEFLRRRTASSHLLTAGCKNFRTQKIGKRYQPNLDPARRKQQHMSHKRRLAPHRQGRVCGSLMTARYCGQGCGLRGWSINPSTGTATPPAY